MKLTRRVLYRQAKPIEFDWPIQNQQLADQMLGFMRQQQGIGLAAPQIGIARRVFVMDVHGSVRVCFNPEIVEYGQTETEFAEGCLSFPGESCIIKRPDTIQVRYQSADGHWTEAELSGLESRCFQHELDHLDGKTMQDRQKEQHAAKS